MERQSFLPLHLKFIKIFFSSQLCKFTFIIHCRRSGIPRLRLNITACQRPCLHCQRFRLHHPVLFIGFELNHRSDGEGQHCSIILNLSLSDPPNTSSGQRVSFYHHTLKCMYICKNKLPVKAVCFCKSGFYKTL